MARLSMIERSEHLLPRGELSGHHGSYKGRRVPATLGGVGLAVDKSVGRGALGCASRWAPRLPKPPRLRKSHQRGVRYAGFLSIGLGSGGDGGDEVSDHWGVHTTWWGNEVWRDYWQLTTHAGLLCVVSHDLLTDKSYLQRVYD